MCGVSAVRWPSGKHSCHLSIDASGYPDYLAASHHGKGIMSAVVQTFIRDWAMPRMGVRQIRVETFADNVGSRRVFEKNGFILEKTVPVNKVLNSGRTITAMDILWWKASQ